jgi:hypothetical protein
MSTPGLPRVAVAGTVFPAKRNHSGTQSAMAMKKDHPNEDFQKKPGTQPLAARLSDENRRAPRLRGRSKLSLPR